MSHTPSLHAEIRRMIPAAVLVFAVCILLIPSAVAANPTVPPVSGAPSDRPLSGAVNPAALYCTLLGYEYEIISTNGGEDGVCILPDGRRVDAWQFFRGNVAQEFSYCARRGYRTEVVDRGDGSYAAECAVCVDDQGKVVGTAAELIGLYQSADLEETPGARSNDQDGASPPAHATESWSSRSGQSRDLPVSFDWREQDGCTPIRNQGNCGSCWAFGTVAALECNILIRDRRLEDLSEQWLVSCNQDGWGCGGGYVAHDYLAGRKKDPCDGTGPVLEADFLYAARDLPCECPYPHAIQYMPPSWDYVGQTDTVPPIQDIKQAILDHGPVTISVSASGAFGGYSGGVFDDCGETQINHTVALVGWDDAQGPEGVWFLRNSWGTGWGEDGYMRIVYGCNRVGYDACFVDYPGVIAVALSFPDHVASAPAGNETIYFEGAVTNIEGVDDVITLSVSEAGGWPIDFQIEGDPAFYQSLEQPLTAGESKGITVRVRTDGVKRIGAGILSARSANTGRVVEADLRVFNGSPSILLVDDDAGTAYDAPFVEALNQLGYLYETVEAGGGMTDMHGFDAVIWQTAYRISPLLQADPDSLMGYLNAGGRLFVSSMDLLTGVNPPNAFISDYLGVESWTVNTRANRAIGVTDDPITAGMDMALSWPGSGANRVDTVNPRSGASVIFGNENGLPAAVRFDGGAFRTVFCTIAQNAFPAEGPDPNNNRALIQRILLWLLPAGPSAVDAATPERPSSVLWTSPNPARRTAEIGYTLSANADRTRLSLINAGGRVVRDLAGGPMMAGAHRVTWDCRDDSGHPIAAGCYFARLETAAGVRTSRIVVVR